MATMTFREMNLEHSKNVTKEEYDQLVNWVGDLAQAINKIARYTESLEERIIELENPSKNVRLS